MVVGGQDGERYEGNNPGLIRRIALGGIWLTPSRPLIM
jgi:hypothetical protein